MMYRIKSHWKFRSPENLNPPSQQLNVVSSPNKTLSWSKVGVYLKEAFGIIGTITSIALAYLAFELQKQGNEMAADNSMQQQQIDTLTTLLKEIRSQNVLNQQQNTRLEDISKEAIIQSKLTNSQLHSTNSILNVNTELSKGQKKQEQEKFLRSYWSLTRLFPLNDHDFYKRLDINAQYEHLKKAIQILDNELTNLHIYTDDSLYKKWLEVSIQAKISVHMIKTDKVLNLNTNTFISEAEKLEDVNRRFGSYYRSYEHMSKYVFHKYILPGDRGWWDVFYKGE